MIYNQSRHAYEVRRKEQYKPGDRVASLILGYFQGMPGTIIRKSQVQYLTYTGYEYDVALDNGRTIRLHQNDMEYLGGIDHE